MGPKADVSQIDEGAALNGQTAAPQLKSNTICNKAAHP
jgi:hypothetical protein